MSLKPDSPSHTGDSIASAQSADVGRQGLNLALKAMYQFCGLRCTPPTSHKMASDASFDSKMPGGGAMYLYRRVDNGEAKSVFCLGAGGMAATYDCIKVSGMTRIPVAIKQISLDKASSERLGASPRGCGVHAAPR